MAPELLRTLLGWVEVLTPAFTKRGFTNALVIFFGWVRTYGPHAVTQALVASGVAGVRHHEAFHRFFSRGSWKPDELGRLLFVRIVKHLVARGAVVDLVLDDTLASHKGPKIFGLGAHVDAVRSSRVFRVFTFGHVWVVLSVVVRVPFSRRPWALPILFRLYRTKKECERRRGRYFKKTELAAEMLGIVARWALDGQLRVSADNAYSNDTVLRGLPKNLHFVGAMRPDAVLTALPTDSERKHTGRRRVRGVELPKPTQLAKSARRPWRTNKVFMYGREQSVQYKTIDAQWYQGAGTRLLRIVIVYVPHGSIDLRVFFSTDASMSVGDILQTYAGRWAAEVAFRDLKQLLGFDESQARKRAAVERTAPFVGAIFTTLVLWFARDVWSNPIAAPPTRPWYSHKKNFSFADVLRAAQRVLVGVDVLDLACNLNNLRKHHAAHASDESPTESSVA